MSASKLSATATREDIVRAFFENGPPTPSRTIEELELYIDAAERVRFLDKAESEQNGIRMRAADIQASIDRAYKLLAAKTYACRPQEVIVPTDRLR